MSSESLWDDTVELLRWRPLLPILHRVRTTTGAPKLIAIREALAFVLKHSYPGADPYSSPAMTTLALVVELAQTDPRVLATIERLLPRESSHDRGFAASAD